MIEGSPVCVVGASGYVGSSVAAHIAASGRPVVGTRHSTPAPTASRRYDFWTDEPTALPSTGPLVFVAQVCRTDRPLAEFGERADALARAWADRRLVLVSTDAVFGETAGPHEAAAAPNPATPYGRRMARFEAAIDRHCTDYAIVRPSYVYGWSTGVLDRRLRRTIEAIRDGGAPAYYDDMYKSPIEVNQLSAIVHRVLESDVVGAVHAAGPRCSVYQFHRHGVAALGGSAECIERDAMPLDSSHPADTSLARSRLRREYGCVPASIEASLLQSSVSDSLRAGPG